MRITTLIALIALIMIPGQPDAGCLLGNTRLDLDLGALGAAEQQHLR